MVYQLYTGVQNPLKRKFITGLMTLAITIGVPTLAAFTNKALPQLNAPWVLSATDEVSPTNSPDTTPNNDSSNGSASDDIQQPNEPATQSSQQATRGAASTAAPGLTVVPNINQEVIGGQGGDRPVGGSGGGNQGGGSDCFCEQVGEIITPVVPPAPIPPAPAPSPVPLPITPPVPAN